MRSYSFTSAVAVGAILLAVAGCESQTEAPNETSAILNDTPAPATTVTTISIANAKCPIMGGKPDAELTVDWNGKTVGFCCDGCPQKWNKLSEEEKTAKFAAVSHSHPPEGHNGHDDIQPEHKE